MREHTGAAARESLELEARCGEPLALLECHTKCAAAVLNEDGPGSAKSGSNPWMLEEPGEARVLECKGDAVPPTEINDAHGKSDKCFVAKLVGVTVIGRAGSNGVERARRGEPDKSNDAKANPVSNSGGALVIEDIEARSKADIKWAGNAHTNGRASSAESQTSSKDLEKGTTRG